MTGGLMKQWQKTALEENPQFTEKQKSILRHGPHFYLPDEVIFFQEIQKLYTGE